MKVLVAILAVLVATMVFVPAYAVIVEFQAEKTSYKKGDKIVFVGKTDAAHANRIVAIRISDPNGNFVLLRETFSDSDGNFKTNPIDTSAENTAVKFATKGVYNATAFYSQESQKIWKFTLFDYSADGSPVSPSAADLMKSQTPTTPTTTPATPQTTPPTTSPTTPPTTQPTTPPATSPPTQNQPTCGPGTVLRDGVCVIAETEPEPEPEPEPEEEPQSGPKKTHIPGFPDPSKDPQYYIDRYNNEPKYREWFDRNFPEDSIHEILGVPGPKKTHIPGFPDPSKDPQYYIDRYNNEPKYREWFDRNFPDNTIYDIVGVAPPGEASSCGAGTHLENGVCVLDKSGGLFGGGCLIATAAYGTEMSLQVQQLRELRDGTLSKTGTGAAFMTAFNSAYYTFSPTIADWERENAAFREAVKITLAPMLSTLSILNHVSIDSESELVGYGLGIMLLNAGIYLGAPAFAIIKVSQIIKSKSRRL